MAKRYHAENNKYMINHASNTKDSKREMVKRYHAENNKYMINHVSKTNMSTRSRKNYPSAKRKLHRRSFDEQDLRALLKSLGKNKVKHFEEDPNDEALRLRYTVNQLRIEHLTRGMHGHSLTCVARNNNLTTPLTATVHLTMNRKYLLIIDCTYHDESLVPSNKLAKHPPSAGFTSSSGGVAPSAPPWGSFGTHSENRLLRRR